MSAASAFLVGILLFIGLPLLGWGPTDVAGFLAHPARALYTVVTVLLAAWFVARLPNAGRGRGRGKRTVERQHIALVLLQVLSLALVVMAPFCDRRGIVVIPGTDGVRYLGLAAYVGGSILMNVAALALGRQNTEPAL